MTDDDYGLHMERIMTRQLKLTPKNTSLVPLRLNLRRKLPRSEKLSHRAIVAITLLNKTTGWLVMTLAR